MDGLGGIGAGRFDLAVEEAACAGVGRSVFFAKERAVAKGVDGGGCDAGFEPGEQVEVVAALTRSGVNMNGIIRYLRYA